MCGKLLLLHRSGLGDRWVPLSWYMWGLTYSIRCQDFLTSILSIFVPRRSHTQADSSLPSFSKSPVTETHTHTRLLSEGGCTLYQRQDPGGRQKIHIRGRWSDIVFGLSAREVLKHPCVNRYLVDSRWCSSITGTVTKFRSGNFSRPLHFLSSQEM